MKKWADYLISGVKRNGSLNKDEFEKFIVQIDENYSAGSPTLMSKSEVIEKILNGKTFRTIFPHSDERWEKGKIVKNIKIDHDYFLRVDLKKIAKDFLGISY